MEVSGYHQLFGYQRAEALIHMFYILIVKAFCKCAVWFSSAWITTDQSDLWINHFDLLIVSCDSLQIFDSKNYYFNNQTLILRCMYDAEQGQISRYSVAFSLVLKVFVMVSEDLGYGVWVVWTTLSNLQYNKKGAWKPSCMKNNDYNPTEIHLFFPHNNVH